MTVPALSLDTLERRTGQDRRGGRPRRKVDVEIVDILTAAGISSRRIARALRINRRTIDRRIADRLASALMFRCQECGALSATSLCPNKHVINPRF